MTIDDLAAARFVPVIRASQARKALVAARALLRGGCKAVEITYTTPGASEVIAELAADGHLVGAGTILDLHQAEIAWTAGAAFLVSPHFEPSVVAVGLASGRLVIPGALTPSEALAAFTAGARTVKIFPVESLGGPRYLKLLRDPLPFLRFFPTGGVTLADAPAYLANGAVAVGVGTALAPADAIEGGDEARLVQLAREWAAALL
ncbi:MAG: 2-dehydro-3-deoxyphosphogluconate aldolase [Cyanobacteria bacterium RYN_339]|nr:2-dehydro-3-deoxyphosphogluconate aldolase [Cyanobacteria bacterium RYN_339]